MATLTELVDTIAAVEGVDPATVGLIARYVREAGLITMRGRGPAAASMGPTDAANLLIAVNATKNATEAATVVSAYRELESHEFRIKGDPRPAQKYGTLGEAIEQLIHATGVGELPELFLGQEVPYDLQEAFSKSDIHIDLKFRTSNPSAFLRIAPLLESDVLAPSMAEEWLATVPVWSIAFVFSPPKLHRSPRERKNKNGDRIEDTTIGYRTLRAVGKLILVQA
jgi:hypothetical protein